MSAHDRYLAGYRAEALRVRCVGCGEWSSVSAETEYGATTWLPEECPRCGSLWSDDCETEPDGPDEDLAYDRARDAEWDGDDGPTGIAAWRSQRHV